MVRNNRVDNKAAFFLACWYLCVSMEQKDDQLLQNCTQMDHLFIFLWEHQHK